VVAVIFFVVTGGSLLFSDLHCIARYPGLVGASSSAELASYETAVTFFFLPLGINRGGRQRWMRMGQRAARSQAAEWGLPSRGVDDLVGAGNPQDKRRRPRTVVPVDAEGFQKQQWSGSYSKEPSPGRMAF
jgi:hypothetical protein